MIDSSLHESDKKNVIFVNEARCIGCRCCEVSCKIENELGPGTWLIKVIQVGPITKNEGLIMYYRVLRCLHCDSPACVEACPTGAMQKRKNGIVVSDPEICIGCRTCSYACPFGIPQLNEITGKIVKCDGCQQRVEQGLVPTCVMNCPTGALVFGESTKLVRNYHRDIARKAARTFRDEVSL